MHKYDEKATRIGTLAAQRLGVALTGVQFIPAPYWMRFSFRDGDKTYIANLGIEVMQDTTERHAAAMLCEILANVIDEGTGDE